MINYLETVLIGRQKAILEQLSGQYEVDRFVATKRQQQLSEHGKGILRRKSVLATLFAAGFSKELLKRNDKERQTTSRSKQATQLAMLVTKFF